MTIEIEICEHSDFFSSIQGIVEHERDLNHIETQELLRSLEVRTFLREKRTQLNHAFIACFNPRPRAGGDAESSTRHIQGVEVFFHMPS
jgi:hypothetical protein